MTRYFIREVCRCGPSFALEEVTKIQLDNIPYNTQRGTSFRHDGNRIQDIFKLCGDCGGYEMYWTEIQALKPKMDLYKEIMGTT